MSTISTNMFLSSTTSRLLQWVQHSQHHSANISNSSDQAANGSCNKVCRNEDWSRGRRMAVKRRGRGAKSAVGPASGSVGWRTLPRLAMFVLSISNLQLIKNNNIDDDNTDVRGTRYAKQCHLRLWRLSVCRPASLCALERYDRHYNGDHEPCSGTI